LQIGHSLLFLMVTVAPECQLTVQRTFFQLLSRLKSSKRWRRTLPLYPLSKMPFVLDSFSNSLVSTFHFSIIPFQIVPTISCFLSTELIFNEWNLGYMSSSLNGKLLFILKLGLIEKWGRCRTLPTVMTNRALRLFASWFLRNTFSSPIVETLGRYCAERERQQCAPKITSPPYRPRRNGYRTPVDPSWSIVSTVLWPYPELSEISSTKMSKEKVHFFYLFRF